MKRYIINSEAWYGESILKTLKKSHPSIIDDIIFGEYTDDDGCIWESKADFYVFDNSGECMKIGMFDDNFIHWKSIKPIYEELSKHRSNINRKKFAYILEKLGYKDDTPRKRD